MKKQSRSGKKKHRAKIRKQKRTSFYFLAGFIFLLSAIAGGIYHCSLAEKTQKLSKQVTVQKPVKKSAPKKQKKETQAAEPPKEEAPPAPIASSYNEDLQLPNDGKITGALASSANQHGVSALKIWEQLQTNQFSASNGQKTVFLTFDDGPSQNTEEILAILKNFGVKATFFATGTAAESQPEQLKKIFDEGHAIGNHTYSHKTDLLYPNHTLNLPAFMSEIDQTNKQFSAILGENFQTRIVRCPGGSMSWQGMDALFAEFKAKGIASIDWNASNNDADGTSKNASELVASCQETAQYETNIVLMHDTNAKNETVKALPAIIQHFLNQGFQFKILV